MVLSQKKKILGINLDFFPIFFVSANCKAHPAQTNTCSATIYLLSPSLSPSLNGFCVCASVICFLWVWGQVFGTCSYSKGLQTEPLSNLIQSRWADKGALGTPTVRRQQKCPLEFSYSPFKVSGLD